MDTKDQRRQAVGLHNAEEGGVPHRMYELEDAPFPMPQTRYNNSFAYVFFAPASAYAGKLLPCTEDMEEAMIHWVDFALTRPIYDNERHQNLAFVFPHRYRMVRWWQVDRVDDPTTGFGLRGRDLVHFALAGPPGRV